MHLSPAEKDRATGVTARSKNKRPSLVRDWAWVKSATRALPDRPDVRGLQALRAFGGFELHLLAFRQTAEAASLNCGVMTEDVRTPVVLSNETEALRIVEPLHSTSCH